MRLSGVRRQDEGALHGTVCGDTKGSTEGDFLKSEYTLYIKERTTTRGEVLKALYIATASPALEDTSILNSFNDASSIPADMADIVAWAAQNGILKGTDAGNADLGVNVTRGQACALAGRAMGTLA